ncbi:competence regulator inhibitor paratox, partial [Streptococcus suis]
DGKIFDFVLPGEEVRPCEVVSEEKLVDVMRELKNM